MASRLAHGLIVAVAIACFLEIAAGARIVGGDGVVFHFHGKREGDFCMVTDPGFQINAHMIGKTHEPQSLTWISALAIMVGDTHLYINSFSEAIWDPFLDHLQIRLNGDELHIPAPGHKAGPTAEAGVWEAEDHKIIITRQRVNEARIVINGLMDLRLIANVADRDLWTDDNSFVHLDMEFRDLKVSPAVHGVLGQTYRPQRVRAARFRAMHNSEGSDDVDSAVLGRKRGPAMIGQITDYLTSGLWATDCKFSKFTTAQAEGALMGDMEPGIQMTRGRKTAGARSAKALASPASEEDVNPLEGYFAENAVRIIRRSKVSSEIDDVSPDALEDSSEDVASTSEEGMVVDIMDSEKGAAVDGSDADELALQADTSGENLLSE